MRVVMFYHFLLSDWNHGNAHSLRGIASELLAVCGLLGLPAAKLSAAGSVPGPAAQLMERIK